MGVSCSFRFTLLWGMMFASCNSLSAQIIIRDTVRINPGPVPAPASLVSSTIRIVFTHNGIVDTNPTRSRVLTIRNRLCGDAETVQINGPVTVASVPARGLGVEASMVCRIINTSYLERSFAFYLDNELVDSLYFVTDCSVACLFQGHIQSVPLYTSFSLGVNDPLKPFELDHGQTSQTFTLSYSSLPCISTVWHPNCATTIRIVEGSELGTLVGSDGTDLGDQYTGTAEQIKTLRFSATGAQPNDEVGEAVVEVSSRGISSRVTFEIRRTAPRVHHFSVTIDPDSIHHGSTAQLFVTARDAEDKVVDIPGDTRLDFFVGSGAGQWGDLGTASEGFVQKGDLLTGVRYDQARAGAVVYVADGENPLGKGPQIVALGVQLQTDPTIGGTGSVKVRCKIDPPHYRQRDPAWASDHYDSAYTVKNGDSLAVGIRTLGCALSCMAMAMTAYGDTVTPGELNAFKKSDSTHADFRFVGDLVKWNAMRRREKKIIVAEPENVDSSFNLATFDPILEKCGLVIVKVFNPESVKDKSKEVQEKAKKEGNHWVLIKGKLREEYDIHDPGRGLTKLSGYGRIYRYVLVYLRNRS